MGRSAKRKENVQSLVRTMLMEGGHGVLDPGLELFEGGLGEH